MNLRASKTKYPATIHVGSIVAFYKSGEKKVEKNKKRKLRRITKIYISSDSQVSKADILYHNANQLRLVDNKLVGPGQNTTRQVDPLICLDDRSDKADVRDLLEHARRTASLAGVAPFPPARQLINLSGGVLAGPNQFVVNQPELVSIVVEDVCFSDLSIRADIDFGDPTKSSFFIFLNLFSLQICERPLDDPRAVE